MKIIIGYLVFCAVLFHSNFVFAVDTTVFGFKIGEPLTLPECNHTYGSLGQVFYNSSNNDACWQRVDNTLVGVYYPIGNNPDISSGTVYLYIIENKIEKIGFKTGGASAQVYILSILKKKYGEPTSIDFVKKSNAYGATLESIEASWEFPELKVVFQGVQSKIDTGHLAISSRKMIDISNKEQIARDKKTLKF
ncbi:MAG: hypothetical protein PHH91_11840 [Desulfuromonadaceae bacterium]|nr:hypothetical protein [Desulfuromonadaceae bacterium]